MSETKKNGSIASAFGWMFLISLLLFWMPVIGSFIAGFVGGRKAGTLGNAIIAALIPSIIIGVLFFLLASTLSGLPLIGAIAGAGGVVLALAGAGPLLLGAIIGGILN